MSKIKQFLIGIVIGVIGAPLKFFFFDLHPIDHIGYGLLINLVIVVVVWALTRKRWPLFAVGLFFGIIIGGALAFWILSSAFSGLHYLL